jgi:phenylacetate-CoA ligase
MTEDPRRVPRRTKATAWFSGGPGVGGLSGGILAEYASAMRSYRLSAPELKRLQERKLRKLISFAFERVPHVHHMMKARGLTPSDFSHPEDLRKLPLLTKELIVASPLEDLLARGVPVRDKKTTSGTTGPPLSVYRGPLTERRIVALRLRRSHVAGVHWWEKEVYVKHSYLKVHTQKASLKRINLLSSPTDAKDMVPRYREIDLNPKNAQAAARILVRYGPSILRGIPSHLRRIAGLVKEYDPSFVVRRIITDSEVLTRGTREDLHALFGGEVFNQYGCMEFTGMGSECKFHNGLHMYTDYFVFEFLGRDGQPAGEGERAEMVVTGLVDDAMPLIRYRLGDIVVRGEDEACPCGCSLPKLKRVEGRASDGLLTVRGDVIPPSTILEYFESTLGLRGFQLVQESETELLLKVNGQLSEDMTKSVREHMSQVLGGEFSLRVELWTKDELSIKFRPVMVSRGLRDSMLRTSAYGTD